MKDASLTRIKAVGLNLQLFTLMVMKSNWYGRFRKGEILMKLKVIAHMGDGRANQKCHKNGYDSDFCSKATTNDDNGNIKSHSDKTKRNLRFEPGKNNKGNGIVRSSSKIYIHINCSGKDKNK